MILLQSGQEEKMEKSSLPTLRRAKLDAYTMGKSL
jgi:hypothetical protein